MGFGLPAINILKYLFGKASDFFMTLSHQRLSVPLVVAAARHLKSRMCFSALINQGIAETNEKIKNTQKVEEKTISAAITPCLQDTRVTQLFRLTTVLRAPVLRPPARG